MSGSEKLDVAAMIARDKLERSKNKVANDHFLIVASVVCIVLSIVLLVIFWMIIQVGPRIDATEYVMVTLIGAFGGLMIALFLSARRDLKKHKAELHRYEDSLLQSK